MSDLIRRTDAIKAFEDVLDCDFPFISEETPRERIEAVPTAEPKRGEWIVNIFDYKSVCSVCGANETDFIYGTEMWYGLGKSKFCPSCGARMKGADDEYDK